MKYMGVFLTYEELIGFKYDKSKLIAFIQGLELGGLFDILSQLSFIEKNNIDVQKLFINHICSIDNQLGLLLRNKCSKNVLYSDQGLLSVWKWLFAYGNPDNLHKQIDIKKGIVIIIYLCLIVSDYLYDDNPDPYNDCFRNVYFNNEDNSFLAINRTYTMFGTIAKEKSLFNEKEFIDLDSIFNKKYGISFSQHLGLTLGIYAMFIKNKPEIISGWSKNGEVVFSTTKLPEYGKNLIKSLVLDFTKAKEWALKAIKNQWDFSLLYETPLFSTKEPFFFPIMLKIYIESFYKGIFYKLEKCFDSKEEKQKFRTFFGRPFEEYVKKQTRDAIRKALKPYLFMEKKYYYIGKDKKEYPDVMVRYRDKLLVVEVKSRRIKLNTIINSDDNELKNDLDEIIRKPLQQANDRLNEILNILKDPDFKDLKQIYLVTVSQNIIPCGFPMVENIVKEIKNNVVNQVCFMTHLSIEEYEYLLTIFCHEKRNIFKILRYYNKNRKSMITFKNFMFAKHLIKGGMREFYSEAKNFLDNELKHILFP